MSFTVKVIFVGLIGFVPNPDGQNGMAALLINPESPQFKSMDCPTPPHLPIVLLLKGKCDDAGDCYRIPPHLKAQAEAMGLGDILKNQQGGLLWLLDQEELDISGDRKKFKFTNPWRFPWAAPKSVRQSTDFDWVPSINKLSSGQGQINDDCLHANRNCPLHARFQFQGGKAGACHVFHDEDDERNVRIFEYLIPGQRLVHRRAVADAVQLEYDAEAEYISLESKRLKEREPAREAKALLRPDGDGKLTLIVANISPFPCEEEDHSRSRGCHSAHADVFFQLLKDPNVPRPVRVLSKRKGNVDPGPCEEEVDAFANLFSCPVYEISGLGRAQGRRQVPHSITACDGTRFPKPGQ